MIVILGVAGSGKSTQGRLLAERLSCPWISMGELLRSHLSGPIQKEMLSGKIIEDHTTLKLLGKKLASEDADREECVLDGCPRTLNQAEWLSGQVKDGKVMMTAVLHLVMDQAAAKSRLLERGRTDDTEEAIATRFQEYEETIVPILGYLQQSGMNVYDIDGSGTVGEVADRIYKALSI